MRRLLVATAAILAAVAFADPASAAPPVHDVLIVKDGTTTIGPLAECPSDVATIDLAFHLQFHGVFTPETFHVTETMNGTFTGRDADGGVMTTGHFVSRTSQQGPGFPILVVTDSIKATGKTADGDRINIRIRYHLTINANDEIAVEFYDVSC